jgi:hypothetical protein
MDLLEHFKVAYAEVIEGVSFAFGFRGPSGSNMTEELVA